MRKLFAFTLLLSSCKLNPVYTDQNGRHYQLKDTCISSHSESRVNYYPDGNGNLQPQTTIEDVCDSTQTHINYLD